MAGIQQARQTPKFSKPNQIIKVAEVRQVVVVYTNSEGRESMCLAQVFGKDTADGRVGVYILAEEQQMIEQLKIAGKLVKDGVRKWVAGEEDVKSDNIPAAVLGQVGELTTGEGFDATKLEIGGGA
ncbi:MAG: hypothetical protein WCP53_13370 [Verrucomicrobiota bacterium]